MSEKNQNQNKPSDIPVEKAGESVVEEPTKAVEQVKPEPEIMEESEKLNKEEPVIEFKEKIILPSEKQYYIDRLEEDKKIIKSLRAELAAAKKKIKDLESKTV